MIIRLGASILAKVQHLQLRGDTYQFYLRVPQKLIDHYGKRFIRKSLNTKDLKEAIRRAEIEARKYKSEFQVLLSGSKETPEEIALAARKIADDYEWDLNWFLYLVDGPAREKYAGDDESIYRHADPREYLKPEEALAWQLMAKPKSSRLSDALQIYLKNHKRGSEASFVRKVERDWRLLTDFTGDIEIEALSRNHARDFCDILLEKGYKTTTVRRILNTVGAIFRSALVELELPKADPFRSLGIQGEGKDAKAPSVATNEQLKEIANELQGNTASPVPLMIMLQIELGARIGEIAGLAIDDIFLETEIPYVFIRSNPWRSLKTDGSERKVPLIGIAFDAAKEALKLPRAGKGLFDSYARERGNDAASAAVNKRLSKWSLTSHSLRHAMKDRLREADCPRDIRDAIQGHESPDIAETYGQGHSLKTMQRWLKKIQIVLP